MYPVDTMPLFFKELTLLNPLRRFLQVSRAIFLKGAGTRDLWGRFVVLALMAAGGVWWATRRFKATL
jgi:ABC-2 type transport system permease protein